jgi:hypothetical protein
VRWGWCLDALQGAPEGFELHDFTGAALDKTSGFELFKFGHSLMTLETVTGSLPLREAETFLGIERHCFQYGHEREVSSL